MSRRQYDPIESKRRDAQAEKEARIRAEIFRADVQQIMKLDSMRRVLGEFFAQVGLDDSPFSPNAMQQSHAIGLQDAAKWWINVIRLHCPEREALIRAEFNKKPRVAPGDDGDDNDD